MGAIRTWVATHKKLTASLLAAVAALIPDEYLDASTKRELIAVVIAFVVGTGLADTGKEAAKIHAVTQTGTPIAVPREVSGQQVSRPTTIIGG